MKNITVLAAVGLLAASSALAGCSPTTEQPSAATDQPTPTVWTGSPAPGAGGHGGPGSGQAPAEGANLHQYIVDNKIAEVPFRKGEAGAPVIAFPFPPDWRSAGPKTPEWAYGAIVYDKPMDPGDPPFMYAIGSKLTGDIDADKVLELAPGQLDELPDFKPTGGPPRRTTFAGFDAVNYSGTFTREGKSHAVGQETVVIPGKDGLFVLQLNGQAPKGQEQVVLDAAALIREQTQITAPS